MPVLISIALLVAACQESLSTAALTSPDRSGSIRVSITTTGPSPDLDGYRVGVDGEGEIPIEIDGTTNLTGLEPGEHSVELMDIASNCAVMGEHPRTVLVTAGDALLVRFQIECSFVEREIAFSRLSDDEPPGIYIMDAGGVHPQRLTDPVRDGFDSDVHPAWSTDGTTIAFGRTMDWGSDVWAMDADGSDLRRLTHSDRAWAPAWSPDGTKIAFGLASDIWIMDADGSNQIPLAQFENGFASSPVWSPDGTRIAFSTNRDGDAEVYVIDVDGTGLVNLTNDPATDTDPAWSPDGTRIAFSSQRDGAFEVYVMGIDGSDPVNLTRSAETTDYDPSWSPDGTRILFVSSRDLRQGAGGRRLHAREIYVMSADGSAPARLTEDPAEDVHPAWAPSSRDP